MDDLFTEGVCFDTSTEGERGTLVWRPPIIYKAQRGLALRHGNGAKRRAGAKQTESSNPMREAGAPSTEEVAGVPAACCARPTGVVMVSPLTLLRNAARAQS
jgi:hypothetical protein